MHSHLPSHVSIAIAAALIGMDRGTFAERYVKSGVLAAKSVEPGHPRLVSVAELAAATGHDLSGDDLLRARNERHDKSTRQKELAAARQEFADAADALIAGDKVLNSLGGPYTPMGSKFAYGTVKPILDHARDLGAKVAALTQEPPVDPAPVTAPRRQPVVVPVDMVLPLRQAREIWERQYMADAIRIAGGNVTKAAKIAGLERSAFYRKARDFGITARKE